MMKCPVCDNLVHEIAENCPSCGARFEPEDPAELLQKQGLVLPNGGSLITGGWALIILGSLLFLVSVLSGNSSRPMSGVDMTWILSLVSAAMFQIGLFLAIAGIIVRAIWFLPGDDKKMPPR